MSYNSFFQRNYGATGHDGFNDATQPLLPGIVDSTDIEIMYNDSDDDSDGYDNNNTAVNVQLLEEVNCSLIHMIREQSATGRDVNNIGPYKSQFQQIARSRRRPMIRTKSESDFQMLMDDDIREMRVKLVHGHNTRHHHTSTFNLKKVTKFTRQQKCVLASIALVDFTSFMSMSILAPFFPNEASKKGMPPWVSGFVFSVYALCIFIASPFMGKAVGHVGPKFLLIIGVFLGGCCNILFGLLDRVETTELFTTYCFIVRIFEALGAAAFATSSYTFVAKLFPDNIGTVLGVLETFVGLGMSVGPAMGGFLYDWGGYGLPFFTLGGLMLLTIPINLYLLPSNDDDEVEPDGSNESMWKLFRLPPIFIISLIIIVSSNTWAFLDPTLALHLAEFNLSAKQLGLFFLVSSVFYAISSPCWGLIADKMRRTWILMVVGLAASSVGLLLLGPSPLIGLDNSIWTNVVALVILGASISMTLLPTFEAMLDFAIDGGYRDETSTYGLIGGLWSSMYSLGEVSGPSFGAFLMDHFGFPICATVMSAVCFVLSIVVFFYFQTCHRVSESADSSIVSRQSAGDKPKSSDICDSGISDKSGSSSISVLISQSEHCNNYRTEDRNNIKREITNEQTPLMSTQKILYAETAPENVARNVDDMLNNLSRSSSESSLESSSELDSSYPDVLRTIGITAFGAIEI